MKSVLCMLAAAVLLLSGCSSNKSTQVQVEPASKPTVVGAGCGQCLLGLKEKKGCDLAIRLDGKSYFVDGFKMKDFGDAHAHDGLCEELRKAKVNGEIVNNRYQATSFELLPVSK